MIEEQAHRICKILKLEVGAEDRAYRTLQYDIHDDEELYGILKTLSDSDLDEVLAFTAIASFGQYGCDTPDTDEESLFNLVAQDVKVEIRNHWTPDITFLQGRTQKQLCEVASGSGYIGFVSGYKKAELVNTLVRHFDSSHAADTPNDSQKKANSWVPAIMQYPATIETAG